jgi:hypothetical protein
MPSSTSRPAWHDTRRAARLWVGLLAPPLVTMVLLESNYVLSYVSCEQRTKWFLHAAVLGALLLVAAAGWTAWTSGPAEADARQSPPATPDTTESRARWMSIAGVVLALWFMLVILAMDIPVLVLKTCQ